MTEKTKHVLIKVLQAHVNNIAGLQFGNYQQAEFLTQRTKMFSLKYFPERTLYIYDLVKISFKPATTEVTARDAWNEAYGCLLAIAQAMLDELQLPHMKLENDAEQRNQNQNRMIYATGFLLIISFILWSFNAWVKWSWLTNHPKRIGLYLSCQLAIIFSYTLLFTKNKRAQFFEWLGMAVATVLCIISLL